MRDDVRVTYLQEGGKEPVLWAATRISDRKVLAIRRTYAPEEKSLATLDRTLFATGAGVTVLVSLAGLVLGVRMGRRATAAAHTAERIADGDLDARVRPRGHDEIARLAASVDTMADALGARLEAERRVTADIAHELRTPVAGMSAAVGLLPPGRASDLVAGSVQKLRGLVEDVLEVARLDSHAAAVETEEREVSAMTRRAVAGLDDVSVKVAADAVVATDPRRVERILANLAANALRHGAPPVEMEVDGPVVRVRDHGPGFPPELLSVLHTSGPQRFRTGSPTGGTGLGLTIATGQARLLGARLTFRNRPEGARRRSCGCRRTDPPGAGARVVLPEITEDHLGAARTLRVRCPAPDLDLAELVNVALRRLRPGRDGHPRPSRLPGRTPVGPPQGVPGLPDGLPADTGPVLTQRPY